MLEIPATHRLPSAAHALCPFGEQTEKVGVHKVALRVDLREATKKVGVHDVGIPGGAKYSARVMIYAGTYAGKWSGGEHGGLMSGVISNAKQ